MKKSCAISDGRDHPIASLSKTTNVFLWERFADDSLSGDVGQLR